MLDPDGVFGGETVDMGQPGLGHGHSSFFTCFFKTVFFAPDRHKKGFRWTVC
jgi:hypothetical protein